MPRQNNENNLSHARLQWSCRRGMLELDVLLGNFLEEVYPGLSPDDQQSFVALLDYSDPELFDWLLGQSLPTNHDLILIINKIRQHAIKPRV